MVELAEIIRTIYRLIKWEIWVFLQIFNIFRWGFGFVMAHRPTPPFIVPPASRYEHTHIVAGTGHGKTQLLQKLLAGDIAEIGHDKGSVIVIDSQGDMIDKIMHMAEMEAISHRLILIDANDIENPPALNLFDFGLDRLEQYSPLDREKLINGAIYLYEYLFGALLGAELTQKQGVIFRYLARLMMVVPGATIHTLSARLL